MSKKILINYNFQLYQGFLEGKGKNRFLREELSFNNLKLYYFAIGINFILRLSWVAKNK